MIIEVPRWFAALGDRGVQAIVLLIGAAAGGFVALGLSWSGLAARLDVSLQLPFLVSGAFGGVALAGAALGIAGAQLDRRQNAVERFYMDDMVRDVAMLADQLPGLVAVRLRARAEALSSARVSPRTPTPAAARVTAPAPAPASAAPVAARSTRAVTGRVRNGQTVHKKDCRMAVGKKLPAFRGSISGDLKACRICQPST